MGMGLRLVALRALVQKTQATLKTLDTTDIKDDCMPKTCQVHVAIKQNCCSIPGWIKPVLAANGAFAFAQLYFQTRMRWELLNGTQRSFDKEKK